jgi:uncharacterized protein YndB with AHSA1/START domain
MPTAERDVRLQCELAAPLAEAWRFLVTPDGVARWLGRPNRDLAAPGPATVVMQHDGRQVTVDIRVERVDPPHVLTFLWRWPGEATSLVELHLEDAGSGCILSLRHARLDHRLHEEYHAGWTDHLARLVAAINAATTNTKGPI